MPKTLCTRLVNEDDTAFLIPVWIVRHLEYRHYTQNQPP